MNTSGIYPTTNRVLIKPEQVLKQKGMIEIPETARSRSQMAQSVGVLVAAGKTAWADDTVNFNCNAPAKVGDRVLYSKYAGVMLKGADGEEYRLVYDQDITALVSDEVKIEEHA